MTDGQTKKRKIQEEQELEINLSAPEPPSKKALRKAKKKGTEPTESTTQAPADEKSSQKSPAEQHSDYGIWIGNLAFSVTKDDLRKFLTSNCSFADTTITRIHLPKTSDAKNKGFAYVDFSNEKALLEALGLSEHLLTGRRVLIKNAKSYEGRPEKSRDEEQEPGSATGSPSKRIFVGNLSFDATKEAIEEHFGQCGALKNVHVATFQDTGKCKGYAWVEFEQVAAAAAAVRGFVMVNEDDEDENMEEEDESDAGNKNRSKPKKPKQRRVWVNQLLGRRMRVEFAEDPTTRYQKRFGKGEGRKRDHGVGAADAGDGSLHEDATEGQKPARYQPQKAKQKPDYARYDEDTVQKLSGNIVESQGQKTTFD
ncbi:hypothetical protein PHISP_08153 [Aspergillus sp. HF37]|nr:hypothetical protein PHISP_08153 [Aspergillus sp. HF37]